MTYAFTFTVFTPTYNRARTLHRVYESLCAQTYRDFEWLVIDDGSTDGTEALVKGWQAEADFPIRYIWQENGGKHTAHNRALAEAQGHFFLPLDSDDECVPSALEQLLATWNTIPEFQRTHYEGIAARCADQFGHFIGVPFPYDPYDSNWLDVFYRAKIHGEKWGFSRTDVLRKYPFPVLQQSSGYLTETIVWMRMARSYRTRYVNDVLRTYHVGSPNALSVAQPGPSDLQRNARTTLLRNQIVLNEQIDHWKEFPVFFLREAILHVRFSWYIERSIAEQWRRLTNAKARAFLLIAVIPGTAIFLRGRMHEITAHWDHERRAHTVA